MFDTNYTITGGCRAARPGIAYAIRTCSAANDNCEQSYERAERGEHVYGGIITAVTRYLSTSNSAWQGGIPQGKRVRNKKS
ncbi:MAG: hypothetical protein HC782_02525 [Gammaproteobacteria bacterium]|nr:hypothetical protein [Gammaproteobacteria bacterium]